VKNLRELRESCGLSQQKLAVHLDLAQSQIQSYEKGAYEPDIGTLKRMADFFDVSVDYIIGRTDIKRKIELMTENELNDTEQDIVNRFRRSPPKQRRCFLLFLDALSGE